MHAAAVQAQDIPVRKVLSHFCAGHADMAPMPSNPPLASEGARRVCPATNMGTLATWRFALLLAAALAAAMSYGVTLPLLPELLQSLPGATVLDAARHTGWLTAVYTLAIFALSPAWGAVSDRVDRRAVMALGLVGTGAALWALDWTASLGWMYVARAAGGAMSAAVLPAVFAYLADASPPGLRQKRFAWVAAATALGFLLGPVMGNLLRDMATGLPGARLMADSPFAVVAYLCVMGAVCVYALPPSRRNAAEAQDTGGIDELRIWQSLVLTALVVLAITVAEVGLTLISRDSVLVRPAQVAAYFAVCSAAMLAVQLWLYPFAEARLGEPRLVTLSLVAMVAGVALLAWPAARWVPAAAFLLAGAAVGVLIPALAVRISEAAGSRQGWGLGRQAAAANLGQAAGAAAAGMLYALSPATPFLLAAVLVSCGALAVVRMRVAPSRSANSAASR